MEELELLDIDSTEDIFYIETEEIEEFELMELTNYEEQGLYNTELESLNVLVIQNYIIISLLFVLILFKRKWVEL